MSKTKTSRKSLSKKKVTKKSSIKVVTKKKSYIEEDGSLTTDVPNGSKFTGTINGDEVSGRIFKASPDKWYLCQNKQIGQISPLMLGYKCSWVFDPSEPHKEGVVIETITPNRKFKLPELPPMLGKYYPKIDKGFIVVGCQTIPNKVVREMVKWLKD